MKMYLVKRVGTTLKAVF